MKPICTVRTVFEHVVSRVRVYTTICNCIKHLKDTLLQRINGYIQVISKIHMHACVHCNV